MISHKVQTLTAGPVSPLRPRGPGGPMGPGKPFVPSFPEGPTGPGGPYSRRKKSTEDLYFVIGFMVVLWWTPVGTRTHSWSGRPGRSSSTLISSLALKMVIFRHDSSFILVCNCMHYSIHLPEVREDPADQWNLDVPSVLSHQILHPHPCHHEALEVPGSNKTIRKHLGKKKRKKEAKFKLCKF